jgi:hypothetical protein
MDRVDAFIVPLPLRSSRARASCRGRGGRWATYTLGPGTDRELRVKVAVVVKRNGDRYHRRRPSNTHFLPLRAEMAMGVIWSLGLSGSLEQHFRSVRS